MFSKKIPNDTNEVSPKLRKSRHKEDKKNDSMPNDFWERQNAIYANANRQAIAWKNANKSLLKKFKIATISIISIGVSAGVALYVTGSVQADMYKVNYDQNLTLWYLDVYAKKAIPSFNKYTTTESAKLAPETLTAINETAKYLVMFQYISKLSDTNFTYLNFNVWVQKYQQWPQSTNPPDPLQTNDNYTNTMNQLVSQLTMKINPASPTDDEGKAEMDSMANFAQTLRNLDMNVYANMNWYKDAVSLQTYTMIPIIAIATIEIGLALWIAGKQRKWIRENAAELKAEETPETTVK